MAYLVYILGSRVSIGVPTHGFYLQHNKSVPHYRLVYMCNVLGGGQYSGLQRMSHIRTTYPCGAVNGNECACCAYVYDVNI